MQQLKVIGTEDDVLVVATETGERFALPINDALRAEIRRTGNGARVEERDPRAVRLSPREIQGHIRAGLSAEEVAALTGALPEDVARYEGPVLAERAFIVAHEWYGTWVRGGSPESKGNVYVCLKREHETRGLQTPHPSSCNFLDLLIVVSSNYSHKGTAP